MRDTVVAPALSTVRTGRKPAPVLVLPLFWGQRKSPNSKESGLLGMQPISYHRDALATTAVQSAQRNLTSPVHSQKAVDCVTWRPDRLLRLKARNCLLSTDMNGGQPVQRTPTLNTLDFQSIPLSNAFGFHTLFRITLKPFWSAFAWLLITESPPLLFPWCHPDQK